jgi:hypothetical protein
MRVLGLAMKHGRRQEDLEVLVRNVFEQLHGGRGEVEWGKKVPDVFKCYQPFSSTIDEFCAKLGQSGFRVGAVNAAFSWLPRAFEYEGGIFLPTAVEAYGRWPVIPMDQWANTCASVALVKLLGKLMSARETGELLPPNAFHALAVRTFANATEDKIHHDDARAEATVTAGDSLHTPCEVGWLSGIVKVVFRDQVNLVRIVGVQRDEVTHGRTQRTDFIPPKALEEYFARVLAPSNGKPTPLLLCLRGYCDSRMGTPMVASGSSNRLGAPWDHNYLKPWTESHRKRLVKMIKNSKDQGEYDGHVVLVTSMFQGRNDDPRKNMRWVVVEDHNEIAGEEGLYAMDVSCLALMTTDVFALQISPDWRAGNYTELFGPSTPVLQPTASAAIEDDSKVFLADVGKEGRWCPILRFLGRATTPGGIVHLLVMVGNTQRTVHVAQGLLNAAAIARWQGLTTNDKDGGFPLVESTSPTASQATIPLHPTYAREGRGHGAERRLDDRAARLAHRERMNVALEDNVESRAGEHVPLEDNVGGREGVQTEEVAEKAGVRKRKLRNGLIKKRMQQNTLGVYKADVFALPVIDNVPPPYRREEKTSVKRCLKSFRVHVDMLRQNIGAVEMEERAYRTGRAVWLLEMAIKKVSGRKWRDLRSLVNDGGIISTALNRPTLVKKFLRRKIKMEEEEIKVTMDKFARAKSEYYYYMNASRLPHIRLYAHSPGGRRKLVSTYPIVMLDFERTYVEASWTMDIVILVLPKASY